MPDTPLVPGEAAALAETVAGLRAANARLRELIAGRDELIAELRVWVAETGELREQVERLQREVADLAARVDAGIVLNAARRSQLQRKRYALATRMRGRADDYLRFAHDLRVPAGNNEAEQVIRMSKLRIEVSGCMRSMRGAEAFCAIRSYLATAARHGIGWLDALTRAAQGYPWIPGTT